jgi:uncharacterized protein YndB with AHSA1/START domain
MKFSGEAIRKTISIHAPVNLVWETLTDPKLAEQWLSDDPITMITDWIVGRPITIRGDLHGMAFENKGIVGAFEPGQLLRYTHLSSLSELPDLPESYCQLEFRLRQTGIQTMLTLTIANFPTETIRQHLDFYWGPTLQFIKRQAEQD